MTTWVALLRGINVGGRNKVPMAELRTLFETLGYHDVASYIQSGNVVFSTDDKTTSRKAEAALSQRLSSEIARAFEVSSPVVLRPKSEWARSLSANPLFTSDRDPARLHLLFLDAKPIGNAVAGLDPDRSPPDEFAVDGRMVYLWLPNGADKSKLTVPYFEKALGVTATARNQRTATKIADLL